MTALGLQTENVTPIVYNYIHSDECIYFGAGGGVEYSLSILLPEIGLIVFKYKHIYLRVYFLRSSLNGILQYVRYSKINVSNGVLTIERPCTSKSSLHIQQVPLKRS